MTTEKITEIGIDEKGQLYVKPEKEHFEFIYRAACEIYWDDKEYYLYSPKPREETYFVWYMQIILATKDEYGCQLVLSDKTKWTNIPDELKSQIIKA